MKAFYIKDKNCRLIYKNLERKKKILKYIINNNKISTKMRKMLYLLLIKLPRKSSISRIENRCRISLRAHAVYRKFKLSRIFLKKMASEGNLMGIRKAE